MLAFILGRVGIMETSTTKVDIYKSLKFFFFFKSPLLKKAYCEWLNQVSAPQCWGQAVVSRTVRKELQQSDATGNPQRC